MEVKLIFYEIETFKKMPQFKNNNRKLGIAINVTSICML